MVVWYNCPCLNIRLCIARLPDPISPDNHNYTSLFDDPHTCWRQLGVSELVTPPNYPGMGTHGSHRKISHAFPLANNPHFSLENLVGRRPSSVSGWTIFHCYICDHDVFAVFRGNEQHPVVNIDQMIYTETSEENTRPTIIKNVHEDAGDAGDEEDFGKGRYYSNSFNILLKLDKEKDCEHDDLPAGESTKDINQLYLDNFNNLEDTLNEYLDNEMQKMNKRIQEYEKLQQHTFLKLKKNALRDKTILSRKMRRCLTERWKNLESNGGVCNHGIPATPGIPVKIGPTTPPTSPSQEHSPSFESSGDNSGLSHELNNALRFKDETLFDFDENTDEFRVSPQKKSKSKSKGKVIESEEDDVSDILPPPDRMDIQMYATSLPVRIPQNTFQVRRLSNAGTPTTDDDTFDSSEKWKVFDDRSFNPLRDDTIKEDNLLSKSFAVPFSTNYTGSKNFPKSFA